MSDKLMKMLSSDSSEEFRQKLDKMPPKKLLKELLSEFTDKEGGVYNVLSYLVCSTNHQASYEKLSHSLKKLSEIKDFNLSDFLNSYRVSEGSMYETSPLYLLAVFNNRPKLMEVLYEYGANPNIVMKKKTELDGNIIAEAIDPKEKLLRKHLELKARYLQENLKEDLNDKPESKKMKI